MKLFKKPKVYRVAKTQRWLGHVLRMSHHRNAKKILTAKEGGKKRTGRAKNRWMVTVTEDLAQLDSGYRKLVGKTKRRKSLKKNNPECRSHGPTSPVELLYRHNF